MSKFSYLLLIVCLSLLISCAQESGGNGDEAQAFQQAYNSYQASNYEQAIGQLSNFIRQYPASEFVDDAYYYRGRSYFFSIQANYVAAQADFETILNQYTANNSNVIDGAQYWLARSLHEQADQLVDPTARLAAFDLALTEYNTLKSAYAGSSWVDNAQFQIGKVYYDQSQFSAAITEFNLVPSFTTNQLNHVEDIAQYYVGKCYHALALQNGYNSGHFDSALAEYAKVETVTAPNTWIDNARYQIGRLYFDRAEFYIVDGQNDLAKADFDTAAQKFSVVAAMQGESSQDIAQYYWGRSLHENALLDPLIDPQVNPNATEKDRYDAKVTALQSAQVQYNAVPTNSNWKDNAQYQIGRTYYDLAAYALTLGNYTDGTNPNVTVEDLAVTAYNQAISEFSLVGGLGNRSSEDDAIYYTGRAHHRSALLLAGQLTEFNNHMAAARAEYAKLINFPRPTNWLDNAHYQTGKTYYEQDNYVQAIPAFAAVIALPKDYLHDNAYYHKGLSHYLNAASHQRAATLPPGSTVAQQYNLAIDTLDSLLSDVSFAASVWLDNAQYRKGLSLYQRGILDSNNITLVDLEGAITALEAAYGTILQQDEADYVIGLARFYQVLQGVQGITYTTVDTRLGRVGGALTAYSDFHRILTQHNQPAACDTATEADRVDRYLQDYQQDTDPDVISMVNEVANHVVAGSHSCTQLETPRLLPIF